MITPEQLSAFRKTYKDDIHAHTLNAAMARTEIKDLACTITDLGMRCFGDHIADVAGPG